MKVVRNCDGNVVVEIWEFGGELFIRDEIWGTLSVDYDISSKCGFRGDLKEGYYWAEGSVVDKDENEWAEVFYYDGWHIKLNCGTFMVCGNLCDVLSVEEGYEIVEEEDKREKTSSGCLSTWRISDCAIEV